MSRGFLASGLSTYDFSTLYTTLPHNLIEEKLTELIEQTFNREGSLYLACNNKNAFFTSEQPKRYKLWSYQKMCDALHYLLDNIFIRFGSKLYRQIVGIPMGTNCAPLVADLFLFCYERDFDFEIVNFPFLDGDVPRSTSYGVYISQLIRFARASSYVTDFNTRNKLLTQKLLKQGYRYHKLRKTFSKFYRRYFDLISKFQVGLKSLLRQGLSEPDFYGDLVYKLKKIVGSNNFSAQFIKIISHYKKIGYNINVLQQTACLVVNPITVGNFAFLFNCTPVGRTSDSMMVPT